MTKTRSALMAFAGGSAAAVIIAVVAHFSSPHVSGAGAIPVGVVLGVAFYLRLRRADQRSQTPPVK